MGPPQWCEWNGRREGGREFAPNALSWIRHCSDTVNCEFLIILHVTLRLIFQNRVTSMEA